MNACPQEGGEDEDEEATVGSDGSPNPHDTPVTGSVSRTHMHAATLIQNNHVG